MHPKPSTHKAVIPKRPYEQVPSRPLMKMPPQKTHKRPEILFWKIWDVLSDVGVVDEHLGKHRAALTPCTVSSQWKKKPGKTGSNPFQAQGRGSGPFFGGPSFFAQAQGSHSGRGNEGPRTPGPSG